MLKKLKMKLKKNKHKEKAVIDDSVSQDFPRLTKSAFDLVALEGFACPSDIRTHGYQQDGSTGEYVFRSFILELGTATLVTGSLDVLYRAGALNLNIFITKYTKNQAIKLYKNATTDEATRLTNMLNTGNFLEVREAEKAIDQAQRLLDEIAEGYNDGFVATIVFTLFAPDEKSLDMQAMLIADHLMASDHKLRVLYARQKSGWISSLPIGNQLINDRNDRKFHDRTTLVAMSPFYSATIPFFGGAPIGINALNGKMEFFNRFASYLSNYSSIIVGTSGSGKSFANKYISASEILLGIRIFSIDPDGENGQICRLLGGNEIVVREDSNICLNICAIREEEIDITLPSGRKTTKTIVPIGTKTGQLLKFYNHLMDGDLVAEEKTLLKSAIRATFEEWGITQDPASLFLDKEVAVRNEDGSVEFTRKRKPEFTLRDIYWHLLVATTRNPNRDSLTYEEITDAYASKLIKVLRGFLRDFPDGALLDGETNLGDGQSADNFIENSVWTNFNTKAVESSDIYPIIMYVITTLGWEYFVKNMKLRHIPKRVKIEEAYQMKRLKGGMSFIEDIARRGRKYYSGVDIITQDLQPFMDSPEGLALLKIAPTQLFLRIGQIAADEKTQLKQMFNLSEGELEVICQKPSSNEGDDNRGVGILRVGGSSAQIKVHVSENMRRFIDTDPDWLANQGLIDMLPDDESNIAISEEMEV